MLVKFDVMCAAETQDGRSYIASPLILRWVSPGQPGYALVKNLSTGKYMIAEYADSAWVGSNAEGWEHTSEFDTVSGRGSSFDTGIEAVEEFVRYNKSMLVHH